MELNRLAKIIRDSARISQKELAEKVGVAQTTISGWEEGRHALSVSTLESIADIFGLNKGYLEDRTQNPFKSSNLIKLFLLQNRLGTIDFKLLEFILESNHHLEFLFLSPTLPIWDRVVRKVVFETPIYAIAIKDGSNNVFLFRVKARSVYQQAIVGLGEFETKAHSVAGEQKKIVIFRRIKISEELYEKIQSWDTVQREDIEPLFKSEFQLTERKKRLLEKIDEISKEYPGFFKKIEGFVNNKENWSN